MAKVYKSSNVNVAQDMIKAYLAKYDYYGENLAIIFNINSGDDELLLSHIEAVSQIFIDAIKDLKEEMKDNENNK